MHLRSLWGMTGLDNSEGACPARWHSTAHAVHTAREEELARVHGRVPKVCCATITARIAAPSIGRSMPPWVLLFAVSTAYGPRGGHMRSSARRHGGRGKRCRLVSTPTRRSWEQLQGETGIRERTSVGQRSAGGSDGQTR